MSKIFKMNGNGGLTEIKKISSLPIGCILTKFSGYGEYYSAWVVGEVSNGCQRIISESRDGYVDGVIELRFTESLSNKFGIGTYYNDEMETITAEEIKILETKLATDKERRKKEATAKAKKDAEITEGLKKEYDYLDVLENMYDMNAVKKNMVKVLKKKFPKTKFSVRKRGYDSYTIEWTDGAPMSGVKEIENLFNGYSFDCSGDYYDPTPSLFNDLFGNIKFINLIRNYSEPINNIKKEIKEYVENCGCQSWNSGSVAYQVFNGLFNDTDLSEVDVENVSVEYPKPDPIGCEVVENYSLKNING